MSHGRSHRRKARLGQNFLVNEGACARIVAAAGDLDGRAVIEVGPGRGALTKLLVARAGRVVALEIDPDLAAVLRETLPSPPLHVIDADAVRADWSALADLALQEEGEPAPGSTSREGHAPPLARTIHEGGASHGESRPFSGSCVTSRSDEVIAPEGEADEEGSRRRGGSYVEDFRPSPTKPAGASARRMRQLRELSGLGGGTACAVPLVANLPYESGTAILLGWLEASARDPRLGAAVVMLQAEVAERVAARPSTKAYGSLAALAQATHRVRNIMDVAPGSFRPPPKVWSRVIRLERLEQPLFPPEARSAHEGFLHAAFAHRRKQMAGALAGFRGLTREAWQELLNRLGHPETARAEELAPAQLIELSRLTAPLPAAE